MVKKAVCLYVFQLPFPLNKKPSTNTIITLFRWVTSYPEIPVSSLSEHSTFGVVCFLFVLMVVQRQPSNQKENRQVWWWRDDGKNKQQTTTTTTTDKRGGGESWWNWELWCNGVGSFLFDLMVVQRQPSNQKENWQVWWWSDDGNNKQQTTTTTTTTDKHGGG